jgi:peptidoglycan/xylan/chitin deacetylase (PgdA/CDA1 family)
VPMKAITLLYHDVFSDDPDESGFPGPGAAVYKLKIKDFHQHVIAIAAAIPAKPASVLALCGNKENIESTPSYPPIFITFDDGGRSAYTTIADMLEEVGWRGHFFVTTDYIGTPTFMNRDQIFELHRRGHVMGSHSRSHPTRMSACSWNELVLEWKISVTMLSEILGEPVRVASVPGGYYSKRVAEAAASAGIQVLFTSEPIMKSASVQGCLVLGRYSLQRWHSPAVAAHLACGHFVPRVQQLALWRAKNIAKITSGKWYPKLRRSILLWWSSP